MKFRRSSRRFLWAALPALVLAVTPASGLERPLPRGPDAFRRPSFILEAFPVLPRSAVDAGGGFSQSTPRGVDLECSVVDWNASDEKPILTLACPAQKGPSPFRVYIRLSWLGSNDRPDNYRKILAPPKTAAKFHSDSRGAYVWLPLQHSCRGRTRQNWVKFSELVDLEMVREPQVATKACTRKDDPSNEEINR